MNLKALIILIELIYADIHMYASRCKKMSYFTQVGLTPFYIKQRIMTVSKDSYFLAS